MDSQLKPIPNYEGYYSITQDGNIYSHPKGGNVNLHGKWPRYSILTNQPLVG